MVEADWLQLDEKTHNPYDTSMLQCGDVRRKLPLRGAAMPAAGGADQERGR